VVTVIIGLLVVPAALLLEGGGKATSPTNLTLLGPTPAPSFCAPAATPTPSTTATPKASPTPSPTPTLSPSGSVSPSATAKASSSP